MFHSESFWENKQPLFSENRKIRDKIALVDENENIISEEHIVSEELNNFFQSETEKTIDLSVFYQQFQRCLEE